MCIPHQTQNFQGMFQILCCIFILINKDKGSPKQSRSWKLLNCFVDSSIIDAKLIFVTPTYGFSCVQKGAHLKLGIVFLDFARFLFRSIKWRDPQNIKESKTFTFFVVGCSIVYAKLDFVPTTSHKIYWENPFLQNLSPLILRSTLIGVKITLRLCYRQTADPQHWYREGRKGS